MKRLYAFAILLILVISMFHVEKINTEAAPSAVITLKGSKKILNKKTFDIYVGEKNISLAYIIGGKKSGIRGKWTSSNKKVVTISKNGTCIAKGNGTSTISFTYYLGKKKRKIDCIINSFTRPSEVSLMDSEGNESSTMKPDSSLRFKTQLTPSDEAIEINDKIESNFKVFYKLFGDEDCKTSTTLGSVDKDGYVSAGHYGGTMYLRAEAKATSRSKKVVYSNVVEITIDGLTKDEEAAEEERKKKEAAEALEKAKLRPARIEIQPQAHIDPSTPNPRPKNSAINVYAYFKIFDGNGKDITFEPTTDLSNLSGTFKWDDMNPTVSFNAFGQKGRATITLINSDKVQVVQGKTFTIPRFVDNSSGELTLTYKQSGYPDISVTGRVNIIAQPAIIRVEVKGIYKRDLQTSNYISVLGDNIKIKKDDMIESFGGNISLNILPNSYYLLLKATDLYNNNVAASGISAQRIDLLVRGDAGLELDNVQGLYGGIAIPQSISPIVIDGMPYLTFPLKPVKVKEGSLDIIARGLPAYKRLISDGSTLLNFSLTGGSAVAGKENIIDYILITTTGQNIKNYEKVLGYLNIANPGNRDRVDLLPNSEIISGSKSSRFFIRKNTSGDAEIVYFPQLNVLKYNPLIPQAPFQPGEEEIITLRGRKNPLTQQSMENKFTIWVYNENK